MADPFVSVWVYAVLIALSLAAGRRSAQLAAFSCVLGYALGLAAKYMFAWIGVHFAPSISVALVVSVAYPLVRERSSPAKALALIATSGVIVIQRIVTGEHSPAEALAGVPLAAVALTVASHLLRLRSGRQFSTRDATLAWNQWPSRSYVPSSHLYFWTRAEVNERYPNVVTPLFADLFLPAVGRAVQRMSRSLNIKKAPASVGYSVRDGYVFSNMGAPLLRFDGLGRRLLRIKREFDNYARETYPKAKDHFWAEHHRVSQAVQCASNPAARLVAVLESLSLFEDWMYHQSVSLFYSTFALYYIRLVVSVHFPIRRREILDNLPLGLPTPSLNRDVLLYKLGRLMTDNPSARWKNLHGEARVAADSLLNTLKDDSASYDFTDAAWSDDPDRLLDLARAAARRSVAPQDLIPQLEKRRLAAECALTKRFRLTHWFKGTALASDTIEMVHTLFPFKEERQAQMAAAWALVRQAVTLAGEDAVAVGALGSTAEVCFLSGPELFAFLHLRVSGRRLPDPTINFNTLHAAATFRQHQFSLLASLPQPEPVGKDMVFELPFRRRTKTHPGGRILTGRYGLPGRTTAPAVVIRNGREFSKMSADHILVAPMTNPQWDVLFGMAAGVIVERGGPVSHAIIKASEYGLPVVVGVNGALAGIRDGDLVTIDGDKREVTLPE